MTKARNRYKLSFLIVLLLVVLSLCVFIGVTYSALKQDFKYETGTLDSDNKPKEDYMEMGTVSINVLKGAELLTSASTISVTDGLQITIKNTGNIRCLVRVAYKFYNTKSQSPLVVSTTPKTGEMKLQFGDNWVNQTPKNYTNLSCGYAYYNLRLNPTQTSPYGIIDKQNNGNPQPNQIDLFKTLDVFDNDIKLELSVEAIAYSGNIYQELAQEEATRDIPVKAYPFGTKESLPSGWTAWQ